jgi:peptidyl-prolyl cis-trans isomerase A (cyclophilin A)
LILLGCTPEAAPLPPSLAQALHGLARTTPLEVMLHTSEGKIPCTLDAQAAPRAVALFVGLARGRAAWRDPRTERVVHTPLYRDLSFFRAIAGAMLQSGCPLDNGTGHPGYRLPVEVAPDDDARLSRPGVLLLAHYQSPPNRVDPSPPPAGHVIGSQFVIGLTDMRHLAGKVSVIGKCRQLAIAHRVAERVVAQQSARLQRVSVGD